MILCYIVLCYIMIILEVGGLQLGTSSKSRHLEIQESGISFCDIHIYIYIYTHTFEKHKIGNL